jgi:hypothetical protein
MEIEREKERERETGLTYIEHSMILIYSPISKITLLGGEHYFSKGALAYTIIKDLASMSQHLPRMASIDCIAILRHRNTKMNKQYKYRPNVVHRALVWLKKIIIFMYTLISSILQSGGSK